MNDVAPAAATVLLVEDNPLTRRTMRLVLASEGFQVMESQDAAGALALAIGRPPAVVVQDLILPDLDGVQLLASLRALPGLEALPALVVSGLSGRRREVEAVRGARTEFLVKPVEPERLIAAVRSLTERPAAPASDEEASGRRLLLVDDDRFNRKLAQVRLEAAGFTVTAAENGQQALARARATPPDVVLSDVLMPGLDGFRLCQELRRLPGLEGLPVVLVSSSFVEAADRELALAIGAHDLVKRTPDLGDALRAVNAALAAAEDRPAPASALPALYVERLGAVLGRQLEGQDRVSRRAAVQAAALSLSAALFQAVESGEHLPAALGDILIHCLDCAGLSRGVLFLAERDGSLRLAAHCGLDAARVVRAEEGFGHPGLLRRVLRAGQTWAIDSLDADPDGRDVLAQVEASSALLVPFAAGSAEFGVLMLASDTHDLVDSAWVSFGRTLGTQFSQAVALAQALSRNAASERELLDLFNGVPVGIYRAGRNGTILNCNRALVSMLGLSSPEALLGRAAGNLWADADAHAGWRRGLAEKGELRGYEAELRRADGQPIWVRLTATGETADGELVYHEAVVEDVTAEKAAVGERDAAQQQLQRVLSASPSILYSLRVRSDGRPTPTWVSPSIASLGFTPEDALEPAWFWSHLHPQDAATVMRGLDQVAREGATVMEYRVADAEGRHHWMRDEERLLQRHADGSLEVIGSWSDVTAHRDLEAQFLQAQKMEALGQLCGGIAHDFNNLLTAISGYAELGLLRVSAGEPLAADLGEIQRAAARAASLTRQLLAFSRRQVMTPVVLDLGEVLATLQPMLARLIGEDVELEVKATAPVRKVRADRTQLEQVVLNLAVNARDAMPDGGRLTLAVEGAAPDARSGEERVALRVTDTGQGMDEATLARVFEPFFTTKAQGKGTGLGLSTVYGIVRQSGGEIELESAPGMGTTFRVLLPTAGADGDAAIEPRPAQPAAGSRGGERVLLVEDEQGVRALVESALRKHGYTVLVAATLADGLALAEKEPAIDLLLTDVVLPGGSGFGLAEQLENRPAPPAVLFISGYSDEAIARRGEINRWRYLGKPFSLDRLLREVRGALDAKR